MLYYEMYRIYVNKYIKLSTNKETIMKMIMFVYYYDDTRTDYDNNAIKIFNLLEHHVITSRTHQHEGHPSILP